MKPPDQSPPQKYRQLLIILIANFVIAPFLKASIGNILSALLLFYAIIVIVRSLALPKIFFSIYIAIAFIAFSFQLSANMAWIPSFNQTFAVLYQGIFALYLGGAAYWIGRDIFTASKVTLDMVRGGVSVYLLIGFVWALFYGIVATLDTQAFSQPLEIDHSYQKVLYFSFTTLTTVGYGDIYPISEIALVLTNLEAIIGQMYVTVFIAILVGSYLSQHSQD